LQQPPRNCKIAGDRKYGAGKSSLCMADVGMGYGKQEKRYSAQHSYNNTVRHAVDGSRNRPQRVNHIRIVEGSVMSDGSCLIYDVI
jgi:hypothetical protein